MSEFHARLNGMITRGLLSKATLGTRRVTGQLRMRAQEVAGKVEIFHPYGMSSNPQPGGDVLIFTIGGTRDHLIALLDDSALRIPGLAPGEFGFRDQNGQQVVFRTNKLEVTSTMPVDITAPTVNVMGNVNVTGTITATVDVVANGKSLHNHLHGGVTTGSGNTGAPV
jgi:phage baseplate assembly protein V